MTTTTQTHEEVLNAKINTLAAEMDRAMETTRNAGQLLKSAWYRDREAQIEAWQQQLKW